MLHSVWSDAESIHVRRKVMTMLAVLALLASVLIWATPQVQAQFGNESPDADAGEDDFANPDEEVELEGTGNDLEDDGNGDVTLKFDWEILTGPYDWVTITPDEDELGKASFTVPNKNYIAGISDSDPQKYKINIRLTVTDSEGATDTDTVVITIRRAPVPNIEVFAGLWDDDFADDPDAILAEVFGRDAIIDGPGENGNRDDEWDIKEGAYLRLDASGSTVPEGEVDRQRWTLRAPSSTPSGITTANSELDSSLGDSETGREIFIVGDTATDPATHPNGTTYKVLPNIGAGQTITSSTLTLIYDLTVQSGTGIPSRDRVRIVIHDVPDDGDGADIPVGVELTNTSKGDAPQEIVSDVENQYLVNAGSVVKFTANVDSGDIAGLRWLGATAGTTNNVATRRISDSATAGTTYTVTVSLGSGADTRTGTVNLLVGKNTLPTIGEVANRSGEDLRDVELASDADVPGLDFYAVNDGSEGITLHGVAHDPDGGPVTYAWSLHEAEGITEAAHLAIKAADSALDNPTELTSDHVKAVKGARSDLEESSLSITLNNASTDTVTFDVPQVEDDTYAILVFSAIDSSNTVNKQYIYISITAVDDPPVADAGPDQQVASGSFVRLNGSGSFDPDPGDSLGWDPDGTPGNGDDVDAYQWTYKGATMNPLPDDRPAFTDAEIEALTGWILEEDSTGTISNSDETKKYSFIVNASGDFRGATQPEKLFKSTDTAYPYFDAPQLVGFTNIQFKFELTVSGSQDNDGDGTFELQTHEDTVFITVAQVGANQFYSGVITGPDFCTNLALGGPQLYAHDSNGDGVADVCSLNTTRRATIARQNALETIASLNPTELINHMTAECAALDDTSYPGDDPNDLAEDVCETNVPASLPVISTNASSYGSVVTGPEFCANRSLGGPFTYPHDADRDGVYEVCSLNSTRREAVVRQAALARFETFDDEELNRLSALDLTNLPSNDDPGTTNVDESDLNDVEREIKRLTEEQTAFEARYANALAAACRALEGQDFGDKPADLASDECSPKAASGAALPS